MDQMKSLVTAILVFQLMSKLSDGQVTIHPPGPLYIPISTQRNITCSRGQLTSVSVLFSDKNPVLYDLVEGSEFVTGIIIISASLTRLFISVNTNDTSVTGIRCEGNIRTVRGVTHDSDILNLTIYDVLDAPSDISLGLEGNSFRTSWNYVRIPTVDVTLYWSLSFFRPSQLSSKTTALLNTNTYNYTLQGVRSCDPFWLCIRAENVVGNSSWSCINNTLPFLPRMEEIEYVLVLVDEKFSLKVTLKIPQECQSPENMNIYCLEVKNIEGKMTFNSPCKLSHDGPILLVTEKLKMKSSYRFHIKSNNCIGEQVSTAVSFCTNTILGIALCSTRSRNTYLLSCDYVRGCNETGCSYYLMSMNYNLNGTIQGNNSDTVEIQDVTYNLTVIDTKGFVVQSEELKFQDVKSCSNTDPTITDVTGVSGGVIAAIAVSLLAAIALIIITIAITACLIKYGYCRGTVSAVLDCCQINPERGDTQKMNSKKMSESALEVTDASTMRKKSMPDEVLHNQEPFYSSLNRMEPTENVFSQESITGREYAKISQEPIYYVLENDNEKDSTGGTDTNLEVAQTRVDFTADEDAPPVPEYNPKDDGIKDEDDNIKDDDGATDISVSGDATPRLSSDSTNYTEVGATSADKDESK